MAAAAPAIIEAFDGNFHAEAELFAVQRHGRKRSLFDQRFDSAAEAMRFAIEEMPEGASNIVLETSSARLDAGHIARIYGSDTFPLRRKADGK